MLVVLLLLSFVCLFVCFVALRPKSTAMVIAGRLLSSLMIRYSTFSQDKVDIQVL